MNEEVIQAYEILLEYICNDKKKINNIVDTFKHYSHTSKELNQLCLYLNKGNTKYAFNILKRPINSKISENFLSVTAFVYGCTLKQADDKGFDKIKEQINAKNFLGYLAYFILKNDDKACTELSKYIKFLPMVQNAVKDEAAEYEKKLLQLEQEDKEKNLALGRESQERKRYIAELINKNQKLKDKIEEQNKEILNKNGLTEKNKKLGTTVEALNKKIKEWEQVDKQNGTTVIKTSLCEIRENEKGKYLYRLFDIENNRLVKFQIDESKLSKFENRVQFFYDTKKYHSFNNGEMGIWEWTAEPNRLDPNIDHAEAIYKKDFCPIEIINLHERNIAGIREKLKNGFRCEIIKENREYLFLTGCKDECFTALYCPKHSLIKENGTIKINKNVYYLEEYKINSRDICKISEKYNGIRYFYAKMQLNIALNKYPMYSPYDIIVKCIAEYATNSNLKELGVARQNWKAFRDFLSTAKEDSIYEKVSRSCGCTLEQAKKYAEDYIEHSELYLNGTDDDTAFLSKLVESNKSLTEKYKEIVKVDWKNEYKEYLTELNNKIAKKRDELYNIQENLNKAKQKLSVKNEELEKTKFKIQQHNSIGENTLQTVRKKINDARKDVSDFLAELIIYNPQFQEHGTINEEQAAYQRENPIDKNKIIETDDIKDFVKLIGENLGDAGVADNCREAVAAYLLSAYYERIPILLAGPAALEIANAFSAGLNGHTAAKFICAGCWDKKLSQEAVHDDSNVIIVENPFSGEWICHLPQIAFKANKLFIFVSPFTEDLAIEPKGLYNYMMPVFTEYFVDSVPKECLNGSRLKGAYSMESCPLSNSTRAMLEPIKHSALLKTQAGKILSRFEKIFEGDNIFYKYLFCMLPLAKVTGTVQNTVNSIKTFRELSEEEKEKLLNILCGDN